MEDHSKRLQCPPFLVHRIVGRMHGLIVGCRLLFCISFYGAELIDDLLNVGSVKIIDGRKSLSAVIKFVSTANDILDEDAVLKRLLHLPLVQ